MPKATAEQIIRQIADRDGETPEFVRAGVNHARAGLGTRRDYRWHQEIAEAATRAGMNTTDYMRASR